MAVGTDVGTMFLVKGEFDPLVNAPSFSVERNCFLEAANSEDTEQVLKDNNWSYIKYDDRFYIVGEEAIRLKNLLTFKGKPEDANIITTKIGDLRRPMKDGVLNTSHDKLSFVIIQQLLKNLIGKPSKAGEHLVFCSPGDPIDSNFNTVFHRKMLFNFLSSLGFKVECIPEALAIIYSEAPSAEDESEPDGVSLFTGISCSFGAGMCNVCLARKKLPLINFSLAKCIPAGNKVFTKDGFKNIEEITNEDYVMGRSGRWVRVHSVSSRVHDGTIMSFMAYGQSRWSTTPEHQILIRRNAEWEWLRADEIICGDRIMQPWEQCSITKHSIGWTCEKTGTYQNVVIFSNGYYVLGRFLGDGSVFKDAHSDRGIQIACNINDDTWTDLRDRMSKTFGCEVYETVNETDNVRLLKIHNTGLAKWFRKNCYNNGEKVFPWSSSDLSENDTRFLIAGIVESDGYVCEEKDLIHIGITSTNLAQLIYLGMCRLGLKPAVHWRHRDGEHEYKGKVIRHTKEIFEVEAAGSRCNQFISWMRNKTIYYDKVEIEGINVAKISEITPEEYHGMVYDITVEDNDHAFCLAGCVVHNCGDWIDKEAARVAGIDVSAMTRFKEKNFDLNNVDYSDMRQASLDIFYQTMIEHVLTNFAAKFSQLSDRIDVPLEIVVAGGTSMVPGFIDKFESVLSAQDLPFKVKGVRHAENPLYTVANGCLAKAMANEKNSQ